MEKSNETQKIKIFDLTEKLKEVTDPADEINIILYCALDLYEADRAYIFEADIELDVGSNTYEVCKDNINSEIDNLQDIVADLVPRWKEHMIKLKPLIIDSVNALKDTEKGEYEILHPQGIESLMIIPFNKHGICGFIGVDNPKSNTHDDKILSILAYLVCNALLKINLSRDLMSSTKNKNILSKNDIYIKTFGDFEVNTFLGNFTEKEIKSKQCFLFFMYLVFNKGKTPTIDDLISVIWPNQEIYEPYGYVKNIAFRTRKMFQNFIGDELIIAKDGSYSCNDKLNFITDYEILEETYLELKQPDLEEELVVENCKKIIELYDGSMLDKLSAEKWLLNSIAKYKSIYMEIIEKYSKILYEKKEYISMLKVLEKAIKINPRIAIFHYYSVLAYIGQKKFDIAKNYLKHAKEILESQMYKELLKIIEKNS